MPVFALRGKADRGLCEKRDAFAEKITLIEKPKARWRFNIAL
jgi:hypothetical protein